MDSLVNALKDTPIPTILVVAGILFLILAISEQIAGKVVVDPSRRKQATLLGLLLLACGITLQILPKPTPSPTQPAPIVEKPEPKSPGQPEPAPSPSPAVTTDSPRPPPASPGPPFLSVGQKLQLPSYIVEVTRIERSGDQSMTRTMVAFRIWTQESGVAFYPDAVRLYIAGVPHAPTRSSGSAYIPKESTSAADATFNIQGPDVDPELHLSEGQVKIVRRLPPVGQ